MGRPPLAKPYSKFDSGCAVQMIQPVIVFRNPSALPATQLPPSWYVYEEKFMGIVKGTDLRQEIMCL